GVVARTQLLDGHTTAPVLPGDLEWLRIAYDTHDARKSGLEPTKIPSRAGGDSEGLMVVSSASIERSAFLADLRPQQSGGLNAVETLDERLPDQNTEFLAGNIHIQIVFLEKKDSDSWTDSEKSQVKAGVEFVKMYFEQQFRNLRVNFSSRTFNANVGWDPIDNALTDEIADIRPLIDDVMTRMGYTGTRGEYLERVNKFNNDARVQFVNADWVFTVFVVDSSHDPDHSFVGRKQVFAQLGGPFMILAFPAVAPGISNFEQFFKHAMTAIFWGMPEDKAAANSCASRSGYLNVLQSNKVVSSDPQGGTKDCGGDWPDPCIAMFSDMAYGYSGGPCEFTSGQLGNRDTDRDNVPDIFDAPPNVIFWGSDIDT
ncbi:MAG: hypothetical protein KAT30_05905, partial [Candidatus Krumholzibacteria bacterium]|nr:hypothetical protein [Candidatus Krumholzibacteria bacterium]